ncbi:Uu.00g134830.m01.CDS01 [Anthostomella pinea]|uniref:Uu.00g134830.m01.CDS01 n=1 Tax=Anthostomella pinea TaxID=933095 RepID=A0AAI8VPY6_9PEZI|nr:Uu.00g134830.m01.CDS01 [Anthostomella pinea]
MSSANGNFGATGDEPLSIESLLSSTWPFILQALMIFNALEDTLRLQGLEIGELKQTIRRGTEEWQQLRDQLQMTRGRVEAYEQNIGSVTQAFEQGIHGMSSNPYKEPSSLVSHPDKFDGEEKDDKKRRRQFRAWLGRARLKINVEKKKYSTKYSKILYAVSRLDGAARIAMDSYLVNIYDHPETPEVWEWANSDALFDWLKRAYDSHNRSGDASREMDDLKQKNTPFNVFLSEFLALAADLGLDDKAKVEKLKQKVNNELQSAVISVFPKPQNGDFDGWVDCYRSLTENILDYAHHTGNKNPFSNNPFNKESNKNNKNNNQNNQNQQNPQHPTRAQTPAAPAGDPMDLDTIKLRRLSATERQKRIDQGLCLYCGGQGHMKNDCPEAPRLPQSGPVARLAGGYNLERPGSAPPGGSNNPFRQGHAADLRVRAIGWKGNADDWPGSAASTQSTPGGYGHGYGHGTGENHGSSGEAKG